jgi:2-hydroxy-6-oxonona-2,4-dienedioate hydrolase
MEARSGLASVGGAQLYYEMAGEGQPFGMIHAGVADSRQWNNEFVHFAQNYRVVRYDLRGYGKSEPVEGEFSHLADLVGVLVALELQGPLILMGCSMGGGLAMDFALAHPARVAALIMVDSGPNGLDLDVPTPEKFAQAEAAWKAGDLDLVAELETQIWFDGMGRTPDEVDPAMRQLLYEMDRHDLAQESRHIGKILPNAETPAAGRLAEIQCPVLVIVGDRDTPYILAAADHMVEHLPSARREMIKDAAHLPNMEHPAEFQRIVDDFLDSLPR